MPFSFTKLFLHGHKVCNAIGEALSVTIICPSFPLIMINSKSTTMHKPKGYTLCDFTVYRLQLLKVKTNLHRLVFILLLVLLFLYCLGSFTVCIYCIYKKVI